MRIAHLSDFHVGKTEHEWPALIALLRRVVLAAPDLLVISGDLVDLPDDESALRQVLEALDETGIPYVAVPGNHDVATPRGTKGNSVFAALFGDYPQVRQFGDLEVVSFDSFSDLLVSDRGDDDREVFARTGCWGDGRVSTAQLHEAATLLHHGARTRIVVVHHHLQAVEDTKVNPLRDAELFLDWCVAHNVDAVFVGHLHQTAQPIKIRGVTRLRVGRSTKPPYPFAIYDSDTRAYVVHQLP